MNQQIKISVRNLVEFILRSGDIDTSRGGISDISPCQEGTRIHKKIQKSMGAEYRAEVPLSLTVPLDFQGDSFELYIEGRADGIIDHGSGEENFRYTIDEIKGIYMEPAHLKEAVPVHLAQAKCYAYMFAKEEGLRQIQVQITYCNIETEALKYFLHVYAFEDLEHWFLKLVKEYEKWANWKYQWEKKRNKSIWQKEFPFAYREGQRDLVAGVYRTILRQKKLFIEAPTGVGKTISTVFPTVKAMAEGKVEKIFYLTAKTIARTVAEDTFSLLIDQGMDLKVVTLTAKEKICILDKCQCNPFDCQRAKGHFDRVNDGVYDLLTGENKITRELILQYAEKHQVCPFEMSLDATNWADAVICDYNYVFDPNAHLRRFFANEKKQDFVFLIDEAHNLVERAREMYSAQLKKNDFLEIRRMVKVYDKKLEKALNACNHDLLEMKRQCEECEEQKDIQMFIFHLLKVVSLLDEFLQGMPNLEKREEVLQFYFTLRNFLAIYEELDERYIIYTDYGEEDTFRITLQCMDPSEKLKYYLEKGKSTIFFSATLLPIYYYKEQLGGEPEDYAVYAPSPFDINNRLLMIGSDVSTKYTRRNKNEFQKIARYIDTFVSGKEGNYFVFFSSYQMMQQIREEMEEKQNQIIWMQVQGMSELQKEEFLEHFKKENRTQIGFCVMGGIFGEGIDLKNDRLIGAVIVGTGLPMVCTERELFRNYYEEKKGTGFDYAYLYNGMNKVLQSAGRVIRTAEDKGVILLLDERFTNFQYKSLFPREWFPNHTVKEDSMKKVLDNFWRNKND
ncbi:MAG: ATP-dependent DNA helicase [Acetivibrio sp.]